ncbi:hypothetical protein [Pararhodospirillum oryzae]|uniref:DUF4139 domain-containing protein n=1 Tax=Pararhodospirillum oryzae TaxID=478448 RepID=A0A512HC14_9PROT|nr:hypothetical protein [Pararhodospirillum oryzae]GEO82992.1 hypothetical protein ROR02_31230 [Pararhodospirillum oryzae]
MTFPPLTPVVLGLGLVAALPALSALGVTPTEEPVLRRVVMSTGGVALFEYTAPTHGTQPLTLTVPLEQVDDVLRTLSVTDPAGPVVGVRLAGQAPLAEVFRTLPLDPDALTSPAALLDALQGTPVTLGGPRAVSGRLLSVTPETTTLPDGGQQTRHRLGLMTAQGLRQVILEETDSLSFDDPAVAEAVRLALEALAGAHHKDARTLSIALSPGEARMVRLVHLAEAPLWKTSYRLTLPTAPREGEADPGEGRLAGWATLENLSGHDWRDVSVTLVSGNPVTFTQDLYAPYHVERPRIPVEVYGRLLPSPDTGAARGGAAVQAAPLALPQPEAMPARLRAAKAPFEADFGATADASSESPPLPLPAPTTVTAQVLFTLAGPVTLGEGQTLLAPLLDQTLPVRRVTHVRAARPADPPLAALSLTNATTAALPPGPVSLTQRTDEGLAFLGDARLPLLPAGETRLLAFAADQDIAVSRQNDEERHVAGLSAARGVLTVRQIRHADTRYTLTNASPQARTVVLDHPRREGWSLVAPEDMEAVATTPEAHRLTFTVPASGQRTVLVRLEHIDMEVLEAGTLDAPALARLSADGALSQDERTAVESLTQLAARAAEYESRAAQIDDEIAEVQQAQASARENLKAVPPDSDLHARFLERLGQLDDRQGTLESQRTDARAEARAARGELESLIGSLKLP